MLGYDRFFLQCTGMISGQKKENKNNLQIEVEAEDRKPRLSYFTFGQGSGLLCGLILTASSFHIWLTTARRINALKTIARYDRKTALVANRYFSGQKDQGPMETRCQLFGWWWTVHPANL